MKLAAKACICPQPTRSGDQEKGTKTKRRRKLEQLNESGDPNPNRQGIIEIGKEDLIGSPMRIGSLFLGGRVVPIAPKPTTRATTAKRRTKAPHRSRQLLQNREPLHGIKPTSRDTATIRGLTGREAAPSPSPPLLQPDKPTEKRRRGLGESGAGTERKR